MAFHNLLNSDVGLRNTAAIDLYDQIMRERKAESFGSIDRIADGLAEVFVENLSQFDLKDSAVYENLKNQIESWEAAPDLSAEAHQKVGFVQGILLNILEEQRKLQLFEEKKRGLLEHCDAYLGYLELKIREESFKKDRTEHNYRFYPSQGESPSDPRGIKGYVSEYKRTNNDNLTKLVNKYKAVSELKGTLQAHEVAVGVKATPVQQAARQLQQFKEKLSSSYTTIAERRDSGFVSFMKGVATTLSLGIAALLGIYKTKGEKISQEAKQFADQADQIVSPSRLKR